MNSTDPESTDVPARGDAPEGAVEADHAPRTESSEAPDEPKTLTTARGLDLTIEEGFITLPVRGGYRNQKPTDPKELRIRTNVYVEDLLERDFFGPDEDQAWDTGFISRLSGVLEGVLRRCSHTAALDIGSVAAALQRAALPASFEEHDGKTKVRIEHELREPLNAEEKREKAPEFIWWRQIFNDDLIQSQVVEGKWHQEAQLVANVAQIPIGVVHRMSVRDFIKIQHVMGEYRKKEEATFP